MPRKAVDYSRTIIYKIQHEDNEELLYVGHTTDFTKRKTAHKQGTNNPNTKVYNIKLYKMIRQNGGWGSFKMLEIKKFSCNDGNEACAEEDRIMKELKSTMNDRRAYTGMTRHEYLKQYNSIDIQKKYRIDNADKLREKKKIYITKNADKIAEKKREKITCECGCVVRRSDKARHNKTKKHLDLMMLK